MKQAIWLTLLMALAGCAQQAPAPPPPLPSGGVISLGEIETDATGACYARAAGPTQTIVVTELVEVMPEVKDRNGVVVTPAIFRNVTRPQTVAVGQGPRFETLCPQLLTPDLVATLQRALLVRRSYDGGISGNYDDATSLAVQRFQRQQGIDSPLLSLRVARDLGLVAVPRR